MSAVDRESLRALVREAIRDALPALASDLAGASAVRSVELKDDDDLARFVADVVRLADDPDEGPRLRDGRIRFRLAGTPGAEASGSTSEQRIERGPVTERHVRSAEAAGARLVLGPAAVLTPMARDRARSAGVEIVRERRGQA